ncbi:MAG: hypothetical protein Q4G70_14465, partial [Pseudomonadota bacterium]|nr:hypothetical protein [Pseudomonadota bacterium]
MSADFHGFDHVHRLGERAMHPIAPRWPRHAALLVLAGTSLPRPHALPDTPITARSGASNYRF